jgi:hypothetical protein
MKEVFQQNVSAETIANGNVVLIRQPVDKNGENMDCFSGNIPDPEDIPWKS